MKNLRGERAATHVIFFLRNSTYYIIGGFEREIINKVTLFLKSLAGAQQLTSSYVYCTSSLSTFSEIRENITIRIAAARRVTKKKQAKDGELKQMLQKVFLIQEKRRKG